LRATLLLHLAVFCLVYGPIRPGTITGSVNDGTGSAVTTAAVSIVNQETSISGDVAWRNPLGSFDELDALGCQLPELRNPGGTNRQGGRVFFKARTENSMWRFWLAAAKRGAENPGGRLYVFALP
jgi:hypothetical protein